MMTGEGKAEDCIVNDVSRRSYDPHTDIIMERNNGLSTSPIAAKSAESPCPKVRQPIPQSPKKDVKIITQNIRSFNPIINSTKQRKTDNKEDRNTAERRNQIKQY